MNRQSLLIRLADNNPFSSSVAGEPWEGRYPHVPEINDHVHIPLLQLAQLLTREPQTPLAALVLGEAGSGKSHLLRRLADGADLSRSDSPATNLAFAYVHPILDPQRPMRHVLREVMVSLAHRARPNHPLNQLQMLLYPVMLDGWSRMLAKKKGSKAEGSALKQAAGDGSWFFQHWLPNQKKKWLRALTDQLAVLLSASGAVDPATLRVMVHLGHRELAPLALSWLRGEDLDYGHAKSLGVVERQRQRLEEVEEEARVVLATLSTLLVHRRTPLLVCFDRLENLRTPAHHQAFEVLIDFLVGEMGCTLPLALVRGEQWRNQLANQLNPHVVQRLEANAFELRGCIPKTASQLVESRLIHALDTLWDPQTSYCQALLAELTPPFSGRQFSREILVTANKRLLALLDQPLPTPHNHQHILLQEWQGWRDRLLADLDNHPPDSERLAHAMGLLIPQESTPIALPSKAMVMTTSKGWLVVDTHQHHMAVLNNLHHASGLLRRPSGRVVVYVRDGRYPIPPPPKWPGTNQALQRFRELGGQDWLLEPQEVAAFYAISHLHQLVVSGDISQLSDEGQWLTVDEKCFYAFLLELPQGEEAHCQPFKQLQERLNSQPLPQPPSQTLTPAVHNRQLANVVASLTHVLEGLPSHMGTASQLIDLLHKRGVHTTLQLLLHGVEKESQRFALIPTTNGAIIQLRGKWRHGIRQTTTPT
ncbi:MAG: hypothetical protein G8345_14665 [Magnetococcales bacterium]|nr:hypothetical protein [Magnetococcales bacterium]NGZ28119.1 hypothetical protein [Magnetococcales bacterium]